MSDNNSKVMKNINNQFVAACAVGDFEAVQFLLNNPIVEHRASANAFQSEGLVRAAGCGHLDIVRYLLTSSELSIHADIHAQKEQAFLFACSWGGVDIVKYLAISPELKEHSDVHNVKGKAFKLAYMDGHLDVLKFLIFDMGISQTPSMKRIMKESPNEEVEKFFKIRDLNSNLKYSLKNSVSETKRFKV